MTRSSSAWWTAEGAAPARSGWNYAGTVTSLSSSGPSGSARPPHLTGTGQASGSITVGLSVSGMHCGSCATLIEEVLAEQVGVQAVSVDLDQGRARIEYDASQLGVDDLTEAIAGAGYSAAPLG